jgi:hypothetical protein
LFSAARLNIRMRLYFQSVSLRLYESVVQIGPEPDLNNPGMKLQAKSEPQNRRISNIEFRRVESLRSVFFKIDRIHYSMLGVRCSMFISFSFD